MVTAKFSKLVERTVARYRASGRFAQGFVRGKLKHDPIYRTLLNLDLPLSSGILLDLGCGRGIAMALIVTAQTSGTALRDAGGVTFRLVGIEQRRQDAVAAQWALGGAAHIITGDIRTAPLPRCAALLLLDVLLYLKPKEQEEMLHRIVDSLEPEGVLVMREADAAAGWRFCITKWAERLCAFARGEWQARYHYRSRQAWRRQLEALGFCVETLPMSRGTPFANVLYLGKRLAP